MCFNQGIWAEVKIVKLILGLVLGFLTTFFSLPLFIKLFHEGGATRPNYYGELIPVGIGIVFIPVYFLVALFLYRWYTEKYLLPFLLGIVFFGFLGLLDDLLGSRDKSGLRAHLRALLYGKLTTGSLKALGGGLGALLICVLTFSYRPWWEIFVSALLMALAANTINLFDLRPGRAIKVFFLWFIILFFGNWGSTPFVLLFPLVGSLIAYAPYDLSAKVMLGDTGANLLGISIGMVTAWTLSFPAQVMVVSFLVLLHLFTEKYSLTKIIEGNRILRYLDHMGWSGPT